MLDLTVPWWELALRGVAVYVVLLVMVRVTGKRTIGQSTPFDLLVLLLLSEAVSNALNAGDDSLVGGLVGAAVLILLNLLVSILTARSPRIQTLLEGKPALIGANGRMDDAALRRENVAPADVEKRLREKEYELAEVEKAFLETDGSISFLRRREQHDSGERR